MIPMLFLLPTDLKCCSQSTKNCALLGFTVNPKAGQRQYVLLAGGQDVHASVLFLALTVAWKCVSPWHSFSML